MNVAVKLVRDVHSAGGTIVVAGDKLRLSAPDPLPDSLMEELRQHKAEVMQLVGAKWDAKTGSVIKWFLESSPPSDPFDLFPHVKVIHPARWWRNLKADIAAGPGGPRAKYRALQKDLKRLAELFGGSDG
jgi:hypothetical protein